MSPSSRAGPVRVVCVDDNPAVYEGLCAMCRGSSKFTFVGSFTRAQDLLQRGVELKPDLVLLDLGMPGEEPLRIMEEFLDQVPTCRVLILSGHCSVDLLTRALDAGAFGYIWKNDGLDDIFRCMSTAAAGQIAFSESAVDGITKDRPGGR